MLPPIELEGSDISLISRLDDGGVDVHESGKAQETEAVHQDEGGQTGVSKAAEALQQRVEEDDGGQVSKDDAGEELKELHSELSR